MPNAASKPAPKATPKPAPKTPAQTPTQTPAETPAQAPAKKRAVSPALEDYLEAILNLCRHTGSARSRDISEALGVHKSTVTAALRTLAGMNLANYSPYEAVTLTPEGSRIAEDVAGRHRALQDFFVNILRVDPATAEAAACGMEHSVPREIVEKLADFAAAMGGCPRLDPAAGSVKGEACSSCREGEGKERAKPAGRKVKAAAAAAAAKAMKAVAEELEEDDAICPGRR